jgi:quercetin dioxygenase-like cupin family protein
MSAITRFLFVGLLACCAAAPASPPPAEDNAKVWAASEMKWENDKVFPSVQSVLLWGNPQSGEHGMLRKFPAGFTPPPHRHPSVERVLVISGTIIVQHSGAQPKALGPGSYSEIPANVEHAVQCRPESDCVFLLSSSGRFAIVPADRPKEH